MSPLESIDTVPRLDLTPQEIGTLIDALRAYHAIYSPLLQRRAQRECAAKSLRGLLLELPRKSVEPMVLTLDGAAPQAVRAMQQCLRAGAWDDEVLLWRHWQAGDEDLGDADGGLRLDGSAAPTPGAKSVGVQRQACGALGNRVHCQAGVFLGDASQRGYTVSGRRLSVP